MLAAAADCEGAVKQKGCGVISRIYGAEGLGETERVAEKKEKRESGGGGGRMEAVCRAAGTGRKCVHLRRRKQLADVS